MPLPSEIIEDISNMVCNFIAYVIMIGIVMWFIGGQGFFSLFAPFFVMWGIPVDPFWFKVAMVLLPLIMIPCFAIGKWLVNEMPAGTLPSMLVVFGGIAINLWFIWGFFVFPSIDSWFEENATNEQKIELIEAKLEQPVIGETAERNYRIELEQLRSQQ